MVLKVRRILVEAELPFLAHPGDAGLDLFSCEECVLAPGEFKTVRTGIALELPKNTMAEVRPRSGLAAQFGVTVLNSPGTIDEGYRGEIKVVLINHGYSKFKVEKFMRIAQVVVRPVYDINVVEVEELSESERGDDGFGSSGF